VAGPDARAAPHPPGIGAAALNVAASLAVWASALLASLGRHADDLASRLDTTGADPVLPTRFRVGEAAAAALVAVGAASDELWRLRGGGPQCLAIDVRAAAASLLSFLLQRAPGISLVREQPATIALFRTRDSGWIHLHGGFPHLHEGTLALLGCGDGAEAIGRAVAEWDGVALEDALAERGLCGAVLRSAAEWAAHPQGAALARVPVVELLRIGDADPTPLPGPRAGEPNARPLAGVRVLDLTRVLAGPTCARTLAEHGADVLHVRSPKLPAIEPFVIDTNAGKRSCFLDLDDRDGADRLRVLVRGADVFSQGYRGGALARRGFAPAQLAALRPGIVVVSIDCYGHEGPWAQRPGWEQLAQTASGMAHEHGGTASASIVPAAVTDYTTGHLAALGVLVALSRRAREGGSWHVRVSLARTAAWIQSLPRTPDGATPSGLDAAVLRAHEIEMDTAWGRLARLGPVLRMGATPPRWDRPPVPLGSDAPSWS
jgi:crotonobetainyl-CoA:carnitine CoA-transferase CaiB-like acyl-CoA transferase